MSFARLPDGIRGSFYTTSKYVGQVACVDISPGTSLSVERYAVFSLKPEDAVKQANEATK
uniref:Uncharacterized protein n=1 Tax=Thermofilum pendens TaxID=2269 RepID=A0A7C3SLX1_THEPE